MENNEYYLMYEKEDSNWWFKGRRYIAISILKRIYQKNKRLKILDFGCGTGRNIIELKKFGDVGGIDIAAKSKEFCKKRGLSIKLVDISKKEANFKCYEKKYDLITAFDVIEHIGDDMLVLKRLKSFLKNDGVLLITVPAFDFLWSNHDKVLHHKRRYNKKELITKLKRGGFSIELVSYYNLFIFPFAILRKIINPKSSSVGLTKDWFGGIFKYLYMLEEALIRKNKVPFGVSIICVAKKVS